MPQNSTDILDKLEEVEPLEYESEKPLIIRQENFVTDLGYQFRYNTVRDIFEHSLNSSGWQDTKNRDYINIRREFKLSKDFRGKAECPGIRAIDEIIDTDLLSPKFNPFHDFFYNQKWDGTDHLTQLINTVTLEEANIKGHTMQELFTLMFTRWMVAAVACTSAADNDTSKANQVMLLLMSKKHGTYKTKWLNNLCPPVFSNYVFCGNIIPTITDNNTANIIAEKIIGNIDDQLDNIMYKDFGLIKSLITAPFVTNRKSFRRDENKRIRRVNWVGSVNSTNIYTDSENRRYLTFEIKSIDWEAAQKINMNQVWLQAYYMYTKQQQRHYFDKVDEGIINAINDRYRQSTAEHDYFTQLFSAAEPANLLAKFYTPSQILSVIKKASGLNIYDKNLATVLTRLGLKKTSSKKSELAPGEPRQGYWLLEHFKKEGDRIIIHDDAPDQIPDPFPTPGK